MSYANIPSQVQVGDDVYGSDGDKVGTVAEVQPTYLVIEKGFFFPTDYYIPVYAITQVGDGQIVLNVSKDAALHSGWETLPAAGTTLTEPGTTDVVTGTTGSGGLGDRHGDRGAPDGRVRSHQRG